MGIWSYRCFRRCTSFSWSYLLVNYHSSRQGAWKMCPQGVSSKSSTGSNSTKQITHSVWSYQFSLPVKFLYLSSIMSSFIAVCLIYIRFKASLAGRSLRHHNIIPRKQRPNTTSVMSPAHAYIKTPGSKLSAATREAVTASLEAWIQEAKTTWFSISFILRKYSFSTV